MLAPREQRGLANHLEEIAMRLVLADDSVLLREGLVRLLEEAGHEVAAQVGDATSLIARTLALRPDAVIVDVRMPPDFTDDGVRAAIELRRRLPGLAVLVLSQYVEEVYARELLATGGGVGYLLKDRVVDLDALNGALSRLASGQMVIDPEVVAQLMTRADTSGQAIARLTGREREVLALIADGRSNVAIARSLSVTPGAVEKHVASIFTKLDLPPSPDDHRRVLAVLAHLRGR
ncbi:MAG: response regulator transcription factor [Bifidobacteriaceae bacterium]|jgi:DNA-binding NarL/FixJ family response regulator|nr:response regulator transcription factor [Bifidobacteriaceae bacterium]